MSSQRRILLELEHTAGTCKQKFPERRMSKPQRKKAGVKSASSGKAAEFFSHKAELVTFDALQETSLVQESEDVISLKKLTKKDSSTREKALRELLERTKEDNQEAVFAAYTHISKIIDKLALDCEPVVRAMTMRLLSSQIAVLKESKKAERYLIQILPYVFFETRDAYGPAAKEAEALIENNFKSGKSKLALRLSFPTLLRMLHEVLVSGESRLLPHQKLLRNDKMEEESERKARITTQALLLLEKLLKTEIHNEDVACEELENILAEYIIKNYGKKNQPLPPPLLRALLSSSRPLSQLNRATTDNIFATLKATDPEACILALDVLIAMLNDSAEGREKSAQEWQKRFVSYIKGVKNEWTWLGNRVLPLLASLASSSVIIERPALISSFLDALTKARPLPSPSPLFMNWANAAAECVKFVLAVMKEATVEEKERALLLASDVLEVVVGEEEESVKQVTSSLLSWILAPGRLAEERRASFASALCINVNKLLRKVPDAVPLLSALLALHHKLFAPLWCLSDLVTDGNLLQLLRSAPPEQLLTIHANIDLVVRLEAPGQPAELAPVYAALLHALPHDDGFPRHQLNPSNLVTALLEDDSEDTTVWPFIKDRIGKNCFEWAMKTWAGGNRTQPAIQLLQRVSAEQRKELADFLLRVTPPPSVLEFLAPIAFRVDLGLQFEMDVGEKILEDFLSHEKSYKQELVDRMSRLLRRLPTKRLHDRILEKVDEGYPSEEMVSFVRCLQEVNVPVLEEKFVMERTKEIIEPIYYYLCDEIELETCYAEEDGCVGDKPVANLLDLLQTARRRAVFYLSLIGEMSEESEKSALRFSVALLIGCIQYARNTVYHYTKIPKEELELFRVWYTSEEMSPIDLCEILDSYPRPLLERILPELLGKQLPVDSRATSSTDFRSQLCRGRPHRLVLDDIVEHVNGDSAVQNAVFTMSASEEVGELSCLSFEMATSLLRRGEDMEKKAAEFVLCGLITMLNSCEEDELAADEGLAGKWTRKRRCSFAAAGIRFAFQAQKRSKLVGEEWESFYLPTVSELAHKWWAELAACRTAAVDCCLPGASRPLNRYLSMLIASLPSQSWKEEPTGWLIPSLLDEVMDQRGQQPATQALLSAARRYLKAEDLATGEDLIASIAIFSRSIGILCEAEARATAEKLEKDDECSGIPEPPYILVKMIQDASPGQWGCLAVLAACVEAIEAMEGDARLIIMESLEGVVLEALPSAISRCQNSSDILSDSNVFLSHPFVESHDYLSLLACRCVYRTFSVLPASVRKWYNTLPKAAAVSLLKFEQAYLSNLIISDEILKVKEANLSKHFGIGEASSLTVRAGGNEVECGYKLEESRMHLTARLPHGYPLLPAAIQVEGALVGVDTSRTWMLQLNAQLMRNSTLARALAAWLSHADRRVEKAETCCICMALVAPGSRQLPKAKCRQCKNKFHASCLYKWFESSNQSTCPLCRTDFTAAP